ncbi:hypothetical protein VCRA2110O318_10228 [Vibrio crassostreae]|nr:hypothetical protein VCRA2117O328_20229 [Vibrio crassostreae]CAK2293312.1 hypothetical protein VCRA2110O318_10228 [Vibrio crassostreae]CAK2473206.1 hypothetical protein VCRA2110O319_20227 [Vibrio crassostreae]CAK2719348.1 hypothetical protein VCRA217O317_10188 [Vibrio crassostreae]
MDSFDGLSIGTMIKQVPFSIVPTLLRTKFVLKPVLTAGLSIIKAGLHYLGSMIMKLSCFCILSLCRLNFQAMRPYRP